MSVPKPSESEALIPAANTPICPKVIQNFIRVPELLDRLVGSIWNEDGSVTDEFKASVGLAVGGLAAPTNVAATDGTSTSSVTITWSPSTGASSYQVWRNTVDDSSTATQVGSPSAATLEDNSVVQGTVYWYWVKAVNAGGTSAFSTSNSGYAANTPSSPILFGSTQSWIVPAGVTTIAVDIWGGGGGGGGIWRAFSIGTVYGGGGGGSGEKRALTGLAVTPGETLNLIVESTPAAAGEAGKDGSNGGDSSIGRSGAVLAYARGGGGGGRGGSSAGAGGVGGNGGTGGTGTNGNTGAAGTVNTGGAGGAAVDSYGGGGAGAGLSDGSAGSLGQIKITPNG